MTEKAKPDFESGKYLFKFCTFNTNSLQILVNNTLYFSSPGNLNDPLDCRFKVKIHNPENFTQKTKEMFKESWVYDERIKCELRNWNLFHGHINDQEDFFRFLIKYLQNLYSGICCFSQIIEDNLLWSHYANEARGMCFVFDKEELLKSIGKNNNGKLYLLRKDAIKYKGVGSAGIKLYKNGNIKYSMNHLFTKTRHWRNEKEYRIISVIKEDNRFFPMSPLEFNRHKVFDEGSLKYVIVGERMPKAHRDLIINICKSKFPTIEVLQHKFDF